MTLTIDESGRVLTETVDGVSMPADHTFAIVNDFVHAPGTTFEELQALCLGLAAEIENMRNEQRSIQSEREK